MLMFEGCPYCRNANNMRIFHIKQWNGQVMDFGPQQIGKWLILAGALIALVGVITMILGRVDLFKLPGDFVFGGKSWRIYLPIASSIIISIMLTLILWLINYFCK
jgi:hypothetical protein